MVEIDITLNKLDAFELAVLAFLVFADRSDVERVTSINALSLASGISNNSVRKAIDGLDDIIDVLDNRRCVARGRAPKQFVVKSKFKSELLKNLRGETLRWLKSIFVPKLNEPHVHKAKLRGLLFLLICSGKRQWILEDVFKANFKVKSKSLCHELLNIFIEHQRCNNFRLELGFLSPSTLNHDWFYIPYSTVFNNDKVSKVDSLNLYIKLIKRYRFITKKDYVVGDMCSFFNPVFSKSRVSQEYKIISTLINKVFLVIDEPEKIMISDKVYLTVLGFIKRMKSLYVTPAKKISNTVPSFQVVMEAYFNRTEFLKNSLEYCSCERAKFFLEKTLNIFTEYQEKELKNILERYSHEYKYVSQYINSSIEKGLN